MQKKLMAVAVAGALAVPGFALAQSSVEVYGTVNMAFGNFKYTDGAAARTADGATPVAWGSSVSKWDVANGASNYGVRSRESLGGGMSAWIQIEQNAPLERSDNQAIKPASRNSAIGIEGNFGNVFIGQWTTPWADLDALWGIGTVGFWGPVTGIIGRRETTGTAPNFSCVNGVGTTPGAANVTTTALICDALAGGGGIGHALAPHFAIGVLPVAGVRGRVPGQVLLPDQRRQGDAVFADGLDARLIDAQCECVDVVGLAAVGGHGRACASGRGV